MALKTKEMVLEFLLDREVHTSMAGYLCMRLSNDVAREFLRYYFRLKENIFAYFMSHELNSPLEGFIVLENQHVIPLPCNEFNKSYPHGFRITFMGSDREQIYDMAAPSQVEMHQWIHHIRCAGTVLLRNKMNNVLRVDDMNEAKSSQRHSTDSRLSRFIPKPLPPPIPPRPRLNDGKANIQSPQNISYTGSKSSSSSISPSPVSPFCLQAMLNKPFSELSALVGAYWARVQPQRFVNDLIDLS